MLRFTLDVSPLGQALRALHQDLDISMAEAMYEAGSMVAEEAQRVHAYTDRSGKLSNSIHAEPVSGSFMGEDLFVDVMADTPYAKFVEDGTKAHPIVARNAKALRFYMRGRLMFRKSVRHPGTKPTYFLKGALERLFPTAVTECAEHGLREGFKRAGFEVT